MLETFELLDRFEILYPEVEEFPLLRRAYIDKDMSSIFKLLEKTNLYADELRKAVIEENLHSIFRLLPDDYEDLRKAVVEENRHSIFRLLPAQYDELRKAVIEKNIRSIFRLLEEKKYYDKLDDLKKAVAEDNLYSLFRLLPDYYSGLKNSICDKNVHSIFRFVDTDDRKTDDLRKAVLEKNLHSVFRLLEDHELRKLLLEDNTNKLWDIIKRYKDVQFVDVLKYFYLNDIEINTDCLSRGQIKSKMWLVDEVSKLDLDLGTVFLCAGWYGTLATLLFESEIKIEKIRSFDIDPTCADIAETFNKKWLLEDWRFKASTLDIMKFKWSKKPAPSDGSVGNMYYETIANDAVVKLKDNPDTIINTSSEHIENFDEWYNNIPDGKLIILQNNNFVDIDEHVNSFKTLKQFSKSAKMKETLYEGELVLPQYKRFMKIGYK